MRQEHFKSQLFSVIALLWFVISSSGCEKECICDNPPTYPSLKVQNQNTDDRRITAVELIGYDFDNLNIEIGESQTFVLDQGMPGGYDNINVVVRHRRANQIGSASTISVDFQNDVTKTVTLKGCISFSGCPGFYLE